MAYRDFDIAQISRRSLLRGGAYLGAAGALAQVPFSRAIAHDYSGQWPNVTAAVEGYLRDNKVANMFVTLGFGLGREVHTIGGGTLAVGGTAQAGMDSLYRIYSMTKPITGMLTMMLIDDGLLGLDQPLADILPAFSKMMVQKVYDGPITEDNIVPAERPITIRQLLTHTAGLGYGIVQKGPIAKAYEARGLIPGQVSRLPIPGLGRGRPVGSLAEFAEGLSKLPLVLQPGTKWSYSVSLDLLGRVIEVVERKPFDQVLRDRLFEPTGMDSTWFQVPANETARLTANYGVINETLVPIDLAATSIYLNRPAFPFGGAGLVSSPRDYDRFQRMLLGYGTIDGRRVMGELAVRVGTSNILPKNATTDGTWVAGQGLGAGGRVTGTGFGWGGAAGTSAFIDYGAQLRAALFTQYMPSDTYPIQTEFPDLVVKDLVAMQGN